MVDAVAGMALLFDGFNDYLRIAHEEIAFPSQVLFMTTFGRQRFANPAQFTCF